MSLLIGDIVTLAALTVPRQTAATLGPDALTFAELDTAANRTANALAGHGVGAGDVVLWCAALTLRSLDVFVACARLGAVFAPLNPGLPEPERDAVRRYLDPRLVLSDQRWREADVVHHATLDGGASTFARRPVDDRAPHIVYLTSGSTGTPKGALVSHRASWLRSAPGGGTFTSGLRGPGGVVCTFPLYHYGGWHYVMEAWQHRTAVHLVPRADAGSVIDVVQRRRPSALYCIPAVWERLLDPEHHRADLRSLLHADTGTSAVAADLVERIKARLPGTTTTILYGSTEAGRMAALHDHDLARKPGSVGRPATPNALWLAADGEVCVAGPALMDGYLGAAPLTGEYRSGDLGHLDEEGYLFLTGRTREVIRTGGESVGPAEVEHALRDLPGVLDVAVVGLPDATWGEVVCAVFVLPDGAPPPTVAQVRSHVDGRLAGFKVPRRVATAATIPRTPATGQIQRGRLRELLTGPPVR
ncbi:acyl--CoA ligase [Dactylosporangium aurantiacum]|uniref:Acyl--CoA ligase n=1 Tax=Dactylosporangium aurantiacum TaxID=35754 RepID=A0A9Q9I9W9_9ACTN|nr:class I adenylate-forming enzyme family protein [Dactylosporangium aurantiacum]MDG6106404.1 class I adenylate-forming enzyme family protein [Dactylosporangium aurantiacum]UWZ50555.1 acyl--CoA ligase [Dactylosporangium aurantiacum]